MLAVPQYAFLMPEIFVNHAFSKEKKVREKITDKSTHVPQNVFKKEKVVGVGDEIQVIFSLRYLFSY